MLWDSGCFATFPILSLCSLFSVRLLRLSFLLCVYASVWAGRVTMEGEDQRNQRAPSCRRHIGSLPETLTNGRGTCAKGHLQWKNKSCQQFAGFCSTWGMMSSCSRVLMTDAWSLAPSRSHTPRLYEPLASYGPGANLETSQADTPLQCASFTRFHSVCVLQINVLIIQLL